MKGDFNEILRANSLYHIYESNAEDGNVVALRGLSISMEEAEAVAVVGPSGSGKSTLLKCLGGLMKPSAGSVELGGTRMTRLTEPSLSSSGRRRCHSSSRTPTYCPTSTHSTTWLSLSCTKGARKAC